MNERAATTIVRRLTSVSDAQVQELAALLIDCVEGGASVSFMLPLSSERALLVAVDGRGAIGGGCCATTYFYRRIGPR